MNQQGASTGSVEDDRHQLDAFRLLLLEALRSLHSFEDIKVTAARILANPRVWTEAEVAMVREAAERISDAVEQTRTEAALQETQKKLTIALEAAQLGTWFLDIVNDTASRRSLRHDQIFGYDTLQPEWSREIARRHIVAEDRDIFDAAFAHAFKTGELDFEVRVQWPDGSIHWMAVRGRFDFDEDGNPVRGGGVNYDISDRKQAETVLRESEERFRLLSEISPVGIFRNNLSGQCIYANAKTLEMTGLSLTENLGDGWGKNLHPEDRDWMYAAWSNFVEQTQLGHRPTYQVEHRYLYEDGSLKWFYAQAVPEYNSQGELVGFIGSIVDITERKQAELALQRYNEALETRVAERTAELLQSLAELRSSKEQLHYQAHHDSLTGLPNRLLFNSCLEQSIQRATQHQTKLAVVFIDLDRFKHINDSLGHRIGDDLLKQVARRLQQAIQDYDSIARISGDEFVVVLAELENVQQAHSAITHLMTSFEVPFSLEGQMVHSTSSMGVSLFPDDGTDASILLRNADTAMYEAKAEGRNIYRFYTEEMTAAALKHVSIENALRVALRQDEFNLVYQPQIDLQTQHWVGLEVLLRWQHPQLGVISPAQFIPIAERSGLIQEIGTWVLHSACVQAKTWLNQGLAFGRIAVNVAASQLNHENFIQVVESALSASGLPPTCLELEVTEGIVMERTAEKIEQLKELRRLGIQLAIDDFGTGYSSLSYLKQLPINKLKIDQSFVRDIPHDSNDMAIAGAVIALGQALEMRIIAEGVENEAQANFLKAKGCHEAQGYLYSKPVPPHEIVPK